MSLKIMTKSLNSVIREGRKKLKGWRTGVLLCTFSSTFVFLINLITTIWAALRYETDPEGRQILYEGDCHVAGRMNTILHLIINALGTILLASSNYCMQCLSAPTREDLDLAHSKNLWLDIGVQSTRNLKHIARRRAVLWWLLVVTSLPLHLFYNSVIFSTISTNEYYVIGVTQSFINSSPTDPYLFEDKGPIYTDLNTANSEAKRLKSLLASGSLERLTVRECLTTYGTQFQTRGSVLLVTDNTTVSAVQWSDRSWYAYGTSPTDWICSNTEAEYGMQCDYSAIFQQLKDNPTTWKPYGESISYCLSEQRPQGCQVQSSLELAIIVITLNLGKAIIMLFIAFGIKEMPLMSIGDAIAEYLRQPDIYTNGMCLSSREDIQLSKGLWEKGPKTFVTKYKRLFAVASKRRWALTLLIYMAMVILIAVLLAVSLTSIKTLNVTISQAGFGKDSPLTLINTNIMGQEGSRALFGNVFLANCGQIILSLIYFSYNGLFTCFAAALEWQSYSLRRKGLRVTQQPTGDQRATQKLQLPYVIAVPLMVLSGFLHWILSQSIFLVSVVVWTFDLTSKEWTKKSPLSDCGYSPLATMAGLIIGTIMVMVLLVMASYRLKSPMPVVGSCSAAIAAACHTASSRWQEGRDAGSQKVQWGVTGYTENGIGHCAFSPEPVGTPEDGQQFE